MRIDIRHIILILAMACLVGCNPVHRVQRTLERHPRAIKEFTEYRDTTITYYDTVIVAGIHVDTQVVTSTRDTVIITRKNLTTRVIRDHDQLSIDSELRPDTIVVTDTLNFAYQQRVMKLNNAYAWQRTLRKSISWALILGLVGLLLRFAVPGVVRAFR